MVSPLCLCVAAHKIVRRQFFGTLLRDNPVANEDD